MINTVLKIAAATALVAVCSITESQAQSPAYYGVSRAQGVPPAYGYAQPYRGGGSYSGYGNYTYNNNCTGCFPGSGPYDSQIAVTGIAAGASVINGLIGAVVQTRQQQAPQQGCRYVQVGTDSYGRPLFTCQ